MFRLFNIEWQKLAASRTFYILVALFLGSLWLATRVAINGSQVFFQARYSSWELANHVAQTVNLLLGVLVVISITNDTVFRQQRQHFVDGLSRGGYFGAKLTLLLLLLVIGIGGLVLAASTQQVEVKQMIGDDGQANVQDLADPINPLNIILNYAISLAGFLSMAFLVGLLVRNTGLAVVIYMLYVLLIERMGLYYLFKKMLVGIVGGVGSAREIAAEKIAELLPTRIFNGLLAINTGKITDPIQGEVHYYMSDAMARSIGIGYIILILLGCYLIMKRRNV